MILSDGLDFYIKRILANNNLNHIPVYSNKVIFRNPDKISPEFPFYEKGCLKCGNCKGYFVAEEKKKGRKVIFIGNGYSDRCAIPQADIVFAKTDLKYYCDMNGYPNYDYNDFYDIINTFDSLVGNENKVTDK